MDELELILNEIIKEKGGNKAAYRNLLNSIAYHESAGTMDPSLKQFGGGPGRGKYQFEVGDYKGGVTAAKRTKQYLESKGLNVPAWLEDAAAKKSLDASTLNSNQQDILFLGNMRMHPKADFSKVWKGEETVQDFWANYHWAGDDRDRNKRIKSFNESYNNYKANHSEISNKLYSGLSEETMAIPEQVKDGTNIKQPKLIKEFIPNDNSINDIKSYVQKMSNGGILNSFNEGGLHETNPHGGIPIGKNATVEQGETSAILPIGKFIFSDRISIKDYKCGGKIK